MNRKNVLRNLFLALICCASMVLAGCTTINPGNVGIQISKVGSNRGVQDVALKTGLVLYNPMWTQIIEYPTYMQTVKWTKSATEGNPADESITFTTKDQMSINADISVSYQLDYNKAPNFYVQFRADDITDFTNGFMRNVVRDSFDEVAGRYTVEDVMGNNAPLLKDVHDMVVQKLSTYGISIEQLGFIGSPRPPQSVIDSINLKVQAEQIVLQKQIEVTQAEADAKKNEAYAQGDAQANIIRAQADATANKLRSESLSPSLVEWTAIQKWDGHRPQVEGSGSGGVLLNINK